ncbi:MAG: glycosyltransferase family 39 protein [Flavobacteriales bacterium]|nr:glycosyltransferase family 39 protein [Flavobacteriales bacterium]
MNTRSIALAFVLLNAALKLLWLGVNDLAYDEPFTVYWSQQPLDRFWAMLGTENNPPLYFLLIKAWSTVAPFEAAWLRVPSAVFSALTVWPLFLLTHRLGGLRAALVASFLFTLNNYHYGFAHEVRAYALFTLLATTGMWLLWRAKNRHHHGIRALIGLSAINTLMVYTHFFGWLAVGVQALCVLVLPELRCIRRDFLLGVAMTLLCFSPYLVIFLSRVGTSMVQGTWLEAPVPEELYNMIWRWSNAPVLAVAFLLVIAVALIRSRARTLILRFAAIWCLVPLLGLFIVSYFAPMFLDRYLVFAGPGFALLVAGSLEQLGLPARWTSAACFIAVSGMLFTFTPWKQGRYQPGGVVQQVQQWCGSDCTLEVVPPWYWLNYLAAEDLEQLRDNQEDLLLSDVYVPNPEDAIELGPTVLVDASGNQGYRPTINSLRKAYPRVDSVEADHRVWVYRFQH